MARRKGDSDKLPQEGQEGPAASHEVAATPRRMPHERPAARRRPRFIQNVLTLLVTDRQSYWRGPGLDRLPVCAAVDQCLNQITIDGRKVKPSLYSVTVLLEQNRSADSPRSPRRCPWPAAVHQSSGPLAAVWLLCPLSRRPRCRLSRLPTFESMARGTKTSQRTGHRRRQRGVVNFHFTVFF